MAISDDALPHSVPVTRDMECRARQSKERHGRKMEQGMGDQGKSQKKNQQLKIWARTNKLWGRAEEAVHDESRPGPWYQ